MQCRIETSRLILRPFDPSDAQAAFEWYGDPGVMRFTPTGPDKSIEETRTRLAGCQNHQKAHGFSKWLILERDSGRDAFDEFRVGRLGAFVHPKNVASIRVLAKVGFRAERQDMVMGMDSIVFSLDENARKGLR